MRPSSQVARLLASTGLVLAAAPNAQASGLLGERYASALMGRIETGSEHLQTYSDAFLGGEARANVPVAEHVDLAFRYGRETLDGSHQGTSLEETEQVFLGEVTYHFRPHSHRLNPFLRLRGGMVRTEVEENNVSHTRDDSAYAVAAGADLGIGEHAAITPEVAYRVVDGEGEVFAGAEANYWLGAGLFLLAKAEYRDEDGDFGYFGGFGYHF